MKLSEDFWRLSRSSWLLLAIVVVVAAKSCGQPEPPAATVSTSIPVTNPIQDALRQSNPAPAREGIAAVILIDTSGSMRETVRDVDGNMQPKIKIAQKSALDLVNQFDTYARAHPDQNISLGIYEFSQRPPSPSVRPIVNLGPPNPAAARSAIQNMIPNGDTPIGDAMIVAKKSLDATGFSKRHILVITDGQNTAGYSPADVTQVISGLSGDDRAAVYFVAFDVAASTFNSVRNAGGLVLAASNETDLKGTLDYVLTGKILAEQPRTH
jgi:hypothetical protein